MNQELSAGAAPIPGRRTAPSEPGRADIGAERSDQVRPDQASRTSGDTAHMAGRLQALQGDCDIVAFAFGRALVLEPVLRCKRKGDDR